MSEQDNRMTSMKYFFPRQHFQMSVGILFNKPFHSNYFHDDIFLMISSSGPCSVFKYSEFIHPHTIFDCRRNPRVNHPHTICDCRRNPRVIHPHTICDCRRNSWVIHPHTTLHILHPHPHTSGPKPHATRPASSRLQLALLTRPGTPYLTLIPPPRLKSVLH